MSASASWLQGRPGKVILWSGRQAQIEIQANVAKGSYRSISEVALNVLSHRKLPLSVIRWMGLAVRHVWTALLWQGDLNVSARLVGAAMCSTC